jgi:long-chain acyl-CoA synthetase
LREQARSTPSGVALRRKALGIWEETTWAQLDERVARIALGLAGAGVSSGDAVALVGDNSPDWIAVDLALQAVGARCVTPWPTLSAGELREDLRRVGVELVICGDEEQYDKVAGLRTIVVDATGVDDSTTLAEIAETGASEPLERYEALLAERSSEDEVCVAFDPAGERAAVTFSASALVAAAEAAAAATMLSSGDRTFCMLPLSAVPARVLDVYAALVSGATVHVPESPASVPIDLVEVAPTALSASPRALELLRATVQVRAARSHGFKRRLQRWAGRHPGGAAKWLVAKPAARLSGLGSARVIVCVGGPLTDPMRAFFRALGPTVTVLEGGAAEAGMVLYDGTPLPGVDASVDDGRLVAKAPWSGRVTDGEVGPLLARNGSSGDAPAAARRDAAAAPRDALVIVGRPGDVVGDNVLPALEAQLRDSPYFTEAALVPGDGGLVAHVGLDVDAAGVWAAQHGVHAPTPRALAADEAVQQLARDEVERLAGGVVADVIVLPRRLTLAAGELTPLLDVRREGLRA